MTITKIGTTLFMLLALAGPVVSFADEGQASIQDAVVRSDQDGSNQDNQVGDGKASRQEARYGQCYKCRSHCGLKGFPPAYSCGTDCGFGWYDDCD